MLPRTLLRLTIAAGAFLVFAPAALALDVNGAKQHFNAGKAAAIKHDYAQALTEFNASLDRIPTWPETYTARGYVFQQLGNREKALRDYTSALAIDPSFTDALWLRGKLLCDMGKLRDAEQDLQAALRLSPKDGNIRHILSVVRQKQGYRM